MMEARARSKICNMLAVLGLLAGCDGDPSSPSERKRDAEAGSDAVGDAASSGTPGLSRWVGSVEGGDVMVAIVASDARARVFFCGGPSSYATATRWLAADVREGQLEFEDAIVRVSAALETGVVHGRLERDGEAHDFSAEAAPAGTLTGLYEGVGSCGRLGLIVAQSRRDDGPRAQGACVGEGHLPEQVEPLLPIALDAGKVPVGEPGAAGQLGLQPAVLTPL